MAQFGDHYDGWRQSRIAGLEKYFDVSLLNNETVLEIGCGYADIGIYFKNKYNCKLTVSDARKEHLVVVEERKLGIPAFIFDCDKDNLSTKYHTIIHWGVLYHIADIEEHLKNICESCDYLLLEAEVIDSTADNDIIYTHEVGYDQAFNNKGSRPSPAFIDKILKNNNFTFKVIVDAILDSTIHCYSWTNENDKLWHPGHRRFWIAWKNGIKSPLLEN